MTIKKYCKTFMMMLLIFALVLTSACSANIPADASKESEVKNEMFKAGTYTATSDGNNGPVTVSVTFDTEKIVSVKVDSHKETPGISDAAIEKIPVSIVEGQTLAVDTVSGATNSSKAILAAVEDCVKQAGGDAEALKVAKNDSTGEKETITVDTDYVIIGAGGSGLIAGITALEQGQDVLIIEKMPFVGGATALSEGYIAGGGSELQAQRGVQDDAETIYQDLMRGGKGKNQENLARIYANNMGQEFDWLVNDIGVKFTEKSPLTFPEHTFNRVMVVDGGGSAYVKLLKEKFDELGGEIMLETKAVELIKNGNAVAGVKAVDGKGNDVIINSKATLIATGGYGASKDLRPEGLEDVVFYGATSSTGDGIKMAEAIGAQTQLMEYMKIYPQGMVNPPESEFTADGALSRNGISSAIGSKQSTNNTGSIYVNLNGERFVNENTDFVSIKEAQMKQEDMRMFIVMDQEGYDNWYEYTSTVLPEEKAEEWFNMESGDPIFARSDDLAVAAEKAGINSEQLSKTVEHFNDMVDNGVDEDFNRNGMSKKLADDGTYYIIELKLRTATTLGGLKVTDSFEVLDVTNEVMTGLFATGEVVGGANGIESMPSCMNAWSLVSGRASGRAVLEYLNTVK